MSEHKRTDAEEILSEFQQTQEPASEPQVSEPESPQEPEQSAPKTEPTPEPEQTSSEPESVVDETKQEEPAQTHEHSYDEMNEEGSTRERNVIFVGTKPIITYVTATVTQLASQPTVTIKARGKRITQAVDVSQMIVKRMDTVGYNVSDVRIASDSLTSQDGKQRNVSTIEIDVTKK